VKRHWSFVVCDKRYLYPIAALLLTLGLVAAFVWKDPVQLNRTGNLIIGVGVWMSMRYSLREGIARYKKASADAPLLPGTNQANIDFFNRIAFTIGDAQLQIHGFALVVIGSFVGSYGDPILRHAFSGRF